jgi:hypothetical protein
LLLETVAAETLLQTVAAETDNAVATSAAAPRPFEHVYYMPEWTIFRMLDVRGKAMAVIYAAFAASAAFEVGV